MDSNNEEKINSNYLEKLGKKLFYYSIIIIIIGVFTLLIFDIFILKDWSERGTFGDTFGFLNTIFSGLAFGGIIYTILLQKEELKEQRIELKYTRKEIQGQKEQMVLQKVEYHFFNLLKLRNELIQSMIDREKHLEGQDIIETALFEFRDEYNKIRKDEDSFQKVQEYFEIMHDRYCENLDPYYRNLFHIIEFIDESEDISDTSIKMLYIDTFKAQLSNSEVVLLAYFGMFIVEDEEYKDLFNYKRLFERYKLLENIILNLEIDRTDLILEHYPHLKRTLKFKKANKFLS